MTNDILLSRNPLRMARNRLLTRITAPASEPLTLAEAKLYLRVDSTDEDSLITDLIIAARMIAENWLKRSLITQAWKLACDDAIPACVPLPMGPVNNITNLVIVNRDATTQSIDSSSYYLNAAMNTLTLDSILIGHRIEISYTTGYGDANDIPTPIKQGMLAHIAAMYDSRGDAGETAIPAQAIALYVPFRELSL